MLTAPGIAAAATVGYMLASVGLIWTLNLGIPHFIEQFFSLLAAPALLIMLIWVPLLRKLGMTSGELYVGPNFIGLVLLLIFYGGVAYGVTWCICRLLRR